MRSNTVLERRLEPEVMDSAEDAAEYASIDNSSVNEAFVDRVLSLAPPEGRLLDVGVGPADIAIALAHRNPSLRITAIDLGEHMLGMARDNVAKAGLCERIRILRADAKATGFPPESFDMVISNSLVHHIPEPLDFFREVRRLLAPRAALYIKDLARPDNEQTLHELVQTYASDCTRYQRSLFHDSLRAALTLNEVREVCARAELPDVNVAQTSDRHWVIERAPQIQPLGG